MVSTLVMLWSLASAAATSTVATPSSSLESAGGAGAGTPDEADALTDQVPAYVPAPPPDPPRPRRYGDKGTSELALGLGYSSRSGFLGAGGYRHFVFDGVAPGVEATYVGGGTLRSRVSQVMGALRLVPIRTANVALVLTGRAGRVFLSDHVDGWGAGGGGGLIIFFGANGNVGLELGYEALRLLPASFCADLSACVLHGPVVGLRISF